MMVLLQYAEDDGPIELYDVWKKPVSETLQLLERLAGETIVGFNLAFDWFHVSKIYTIWKTLPQDWIPEEHIFEIALREPDGQDGPCIKPASACDLMLHARKGEFQTLMDRKDIRIRRVPTPLAYALADELEQRIDLPDIFFARFSDPSVRWRVYDIEDQPEFKNVVLKFGASGGLKYLAEYALGYQPKFHFKDVEPDRSLWPFELGYAPTALAVAKPPTWEVKVKNKDSKQPTIRYAWPALIRHHIEHWASNANAREYARDDITYTRDLYRYFGNPDPGDDDSVLACMVPAIRWHGYRIDTAAIRDLQEKAQRTVDASPINTNKPAEVRSYLNEVMDDTEAMAILTTTNRKKLEAIEKWIVTEEELCFKCLGSGCLRCDSGTLRKGSHPAAKRAKEILGVKFAVKELELYSKLLRAGKLHAEFNVIGTVSSRMSGGGGLNVQGIKRTKDVRACFPLAWDGMRLSLGDFSSFEVTLADAVYNDPKLRAFIVSDKKLHALFGTLLFPGKTYDEVKASDGTEFDMYTTAKSGVFAMIYGGNAETLQRNQGIPKDTAEKAFDEWGRMFPGIGEARKRVEQAFCSMQQPDGIGSRVTWSEPQDYCETFLGFRRYFTLENRIAKELFALAQKPPKHWRDQDIKCVRRDRVQTGAGAVASALYGAAFGIQGANLRAAANHEIQSPGAQITKAAQRRVWDLQPAGVHEWVVAPMNIHDEILCVHKPEVTDQVAQVIQETVESFRPQVPLIGMEWHQECTSWASKKGTGVNKTLNFTYDKESVLTRA